MAQNCSSLMLPQTLSLEGKNAIVTGGARGIGAQIALELARRGANVAFGFQADSSKAKAQAIVETIQQLGRKAVAIQTELSRPNVGEEIVQQARQGLETEIIDILVNNAAADQAPGLCTQFDNDTFDRIMHVNVRAPMLLLKAAEPFLPKKGGRIISISASQARQPAGNMALYSSSKAALECLSRSWAAELGRRYTLTSNVVEVGVVETDFFVNHSEEVKEALRELPSAERRFGHVSDIAEIVAFLASDSARWINGDTIAGNGGTNYM
ncbi:hypothetical protein N7504_000836 [Penicillium tannophilum]|nr:hypothetical protein N7504_000836 [Penicillium tannophilum]